MERSLNHKNHKKFLALIGALCFFVLSYYNALPPQNNISAAPVLSSARAKHILYGDATGGGHRHGLGKACKSEFPKNWDDQKIIETVKTLAANDNLNWRQQDNGYHTAETMAQGVKVRIVLGRNKRDIITAYPVDVPRNPCPTNRDAANDNARQQ